MTPWTYAVGTLSFWSGMALALRGLYLIARVVAKAPGLDRHRSMNGAGIALMLCGAAFVASHFLLPTSTVGLPIVWPVLSVQALLSSVCAVFALVGIGQVIVNGSRRMTFLGWAAASGLCWLLPRANPVPVQLLTGQLNLSPAGLLGLFGLAFAAMIAMAVSARSAKTKGLLKAVSSHVALLVGVAVFGLPFLFLLVTSFKEDKDMSSAHGIIWTPRVKQTAPVMDDELPFYEASYKGIKVTAALTSKNADGTLTLTIEHPVYFGGYSFNLPEHQAHRIPREMPLVTATLDGQNVRGVVFRELTDGSQDVELLEPASMKGQRRVFAPKTTEFVRPISLRWKNYVEALEFLPPEANFGLTYLKNTLWLVIMNTLGALVSCSLVAYAFARLRFPGKDALFTVMLCTMMLPTAVTLLPQFLIFRELGWINSLKPMWVTSWFASAFNVFLMRQFFEQIPYELEDAAKIDGCSYLKSLWSVMLPQVKPALAVIAIMTFMGAWNNFMGPLVYSSSPETLPISYAVQLFNGERNGDPGLLMAFVTMSLAPVIALFFFAQRFFIEGVTLSGFGGR